MAYKFQLGTATLGGNLQVATGSAYFGNDVSDSFATAVVAEIDDGEVAVTKLAVADGTIIVGDGDGEGAARTMSGDATLSNTGVLTIAANAIEDSMVNDNVAVGLAGNGLAASSGVLAVQVSGALKLDGDKVGLSGSIAGTGLMALGGPDATSVLQLDIGGLTALGGASVAQADEFVMDDAGAIKKITFSNLEDTIFGNVSGDASIAAGGALTIAGGSVETGMLADDAVTSAKIADDAVVSAAIADDAITSALIATGAVVADGLAAGAVQTAAIGDDQVTYAKIQNVSATNVILGRDSDGAGVIEEIGPAALRTMINVEDGATGDQTAAEIFALLNSDAGGNFTIGTQSDDTATFSGGLTVAGDLTVNGTTTTLNVTNLEVEDNNILIRSGSAPADGSGITIGTSGTPVTLQMADSAANLACSVPLKASSFIGNASSATILATARNIGGVSFDGSADINLPGVNQAGNQDTSGTAAVATTVTVADESSDTTCNVLFTTAATGDLGPKSGTNLTFNSANGTLTATEFVGGGAGLTGLPAGNPIISTKTDSADLSLGVNVLTLDSDAHHVLRLPNSAANGDRIWVKAPSNASAARTANITGSLAGPGLTIDGVASIRLQSPDAAVCLVYVGSNAWKVF